jgi:catalase
MSAQYLQPDHERWVGTAVNFASDVLDVDFDQPREFWKIVLGRQPGQQKAFVNNVSVHLRNAIKDIRMATYREYSSTACRVPRSNVVG